MAYKFSVGAYAHSGSLSAASDITGSTTVSGAVGQFGTLTVASFSPANISSTNITASSNMSASTANFGTLTVGTFSPANISTTTLTVTGVTTLSGNVALGDAPADVITVNGQITGSLFQINGGTINATTIGASTQSSGKFTTLSASSTLDVGGTTTVQALSSSVGVSASVGQFGTLTVGTFSPVNLSVSGDSTLGDSFAVDKVIFNSKVSSSIMPTGSTFSLGDPSGNDLWKLYASTISGSSTLTIAGASTLQAVTATTISASSILQVGGALTVAGATTLNGDLTVNGAITYVSSSVVEFKDVNLILASGSTTSAQVNGAGLTLGNTGYQLKFVSGSMGTTGDSWQFSGSTGFTDFTAGNITGTSLLNTKIIESIESASTATINISKFITLADSTAADITANLPAAGGSFTGVTFKVKNVGTNSVFVKSLGGTIDGVAAATGVTLGTQYAAATFVCDGTNWHVF